MEEYVKAALFVFDDDGKSYHDAVVENRCGVSVTPVGVQEFLADAHRLSRDISHLVVAAKLKDVKQVMKKAMECGCTLGLLPLREQKSLRRCYRIPDDENEMVALSLRSQHKAVDVVYCNDILLLFKGIAGEIPLVDSRRNVSRLSIFLEGVAKITSLRLLPFTITTKGEGDNTLKTAASGCMVLEQNEHSFASSMMGHESSSFDGLVSMVIVAPISVVDYLRLMWARLLFSGGSKSVPTSVGFIKSSEIHIESEESLSFVIDGEETTSLPAVVKAMPAALQLNCNLGDDPEELSEQRDKTEKYVVGSLPAGKELEKARNKRVPFFTYASEERFKDLFVALRNDATIHTQYVVLMILSTVIATVGLYLDSVSVVIGAMVLAPLMGPIIAMSMGLLRHDRKIMQRSLWTVSLGVVLSLSTSALLTLLLTYQPVTAEMQARLHPTLLDLIVAIAAGVAGAYTKSFKEILQSLAGVAIAVALVPPLAVAGIGLGRFELHFFSQAFLLFSTNLIGIVVAATVTFRLLGYSSAVQNKRGIGVVLAFLVAISIPLFISYQSIVEREQWELDWKKEACVVHGKTFTVNEVNLQKNRGKDVLTLELGSPEDLNRDDLEEFVKEVKKKMGADDLEVHIRVTHVL